MGYITRPNNLIDIKYCEQIKQECKNNINNRYQLKNILKREWTYISIKYSEETLICYHFIPINYIIYALNIEELIEDYTKFITKLNSNTLDSFDFYNFNECINNIKY